MVAAPEHRTLFVGLSGPDRPGITAALMAALGRADAMLADVEQVAVRRQLVLSAVMSVAADRVDELRKELLLLGYDRDLNVTFDEVDDEPTDRALGVVVTVISQQVDPAALHAIAAAIAARGGNIDRILRLARYPVTAYELVVLGAPIEDLRADLVVVARDHGVDIALQPEGLGRRAQRLIVMDVDSTLIQDEVIELLADEAGCADEVRRLTSAAMAGHSDFEDTLRARVALLEGLDTAALERARARVRLAPGARTFVRTLRRLGFKVAIVSGGFTFFTDHLKDELGLDHAFANRLEVVDGRLTGRVEGRVVDRRRKAELLAEVAEAEGIDLEQTVAVGDGANDLDMLAAAGLGVAFNAKPVLRDAADTTVNVPFLDAVLFILGVPRSEVEAADRAEGLDERWGDPDEALTT